MGRRIGRSPLVSHSQRVFGLVHHGVEVEHPPFRPGGIEFLVAKCRAQVGLQCSNHRLHMPIGLNAQPFPSSRGAREAAHTQPGLIAAGGDRGEGLQA